MTAAPGKTRGNGEVADDEDENPFTEPRKPPIRKTGSHRKSR